MPDPLSSRDKILDVAEALFARRGYMGVGMRELAEATELGKSSLFHHFRGKAALYCEVVARVLSRIEASLAPALALPLGPAERLERWVSVLVDHLAEQPTAARLLLRALFEEEEFAADPPEAAARAEAILASQVAGLQRLLREGIEAGVFRRASTAHTVQTLIGATVYHFASAEVGEGILGKPLFSAEAVSERKAELISLLRYGLAAPASPHQNPEETPVEKLIQTHRKQLGSFEVIDIVDEQEIARLRAQIDVKVPMQLHWTWNYGSEVAELRNLYEKGKQNQWNAEVDLDWSVPVSKDEWVLNPQASMLAQVCALMGKDEATQKAAAFDELNYLFSQLLHGEQAALQLCGQLTNVCDKMDEKWYAASQVIDEARHVEAFAKLMQRKFGTIYPIGPTLKTLLDILLEAETAQKKTLGMQTLFEGMAVGIMDMMRNECRNPLIVEALRRIEQDEARHAAFGVLMMRRVVRQASSEERNAMEDWAFQILEALNANQQLDMLHLLGPKYDIDPDNVTQMFVSLPNFAELNSMPYMHTVVPNLRNLGLITERTESRWKQLGMMVESPAGVKGVRAIA